MKLLCWNVNGIRAAQKKGFVEWMASADPDILCLNETKAAPEQLDKALLEVPGYQSYFSSSVVKKGYSGVAIYTKVKPKKVLHGYGVEKFDQEGRIIIAEYDDFVLINNYYPNGKKNTERLQYKMDFYEAFLDYALGIKKKKKNLVICGDFNTAHKEIDLARPKENENTSGFLKVERDWMDTFVDKGFVDTFRMFNDKGENYTWWDQVTRARDRNVGWRIDYFFVNKEFSSRVKSAAIYPDVMGSDHCPVGIELS